MKNLKNHKKNGFTLTEIAIAVMIVGVLLALTIPVLTGILQKSDDYAYYMAYKTVEKMGGQIVALGDPEDTLYNAELDNNLRFAAAPAESSVFGSSALKIRSFFESLGSRFAYTEKYLYKKFFPKSYAASNEYIQSSWEGSALKEMITAAKVCKGEQIQYGTDENGAPLYYKKEDFDGEEGENACSAYQDSSIMADFIFDNDICNITNNDYSSLYNTYVTNGGDDSPSKLCEYLKTKCTNFDSSNGYSYSVESQNVHTDAYVDDEGEQVEAEDEFTCYFKVHQLDNSTGGNSSVQVSPPQVTNICTPSYGYYGMYNAASPYAVSCECNTGTQESFNNDKVCCQPRIGYTAYATSYGGCRYCFFNRDFNPLTDNCCPSHSVFNGTSCSPVEGYGNCDANECHRIKCSKGLHFDAATETCVLNPPIVKANRLCELIAENWNVSSKNCSTFSGSPSVYSQVFTAATGTNGTYLSIASKSGNAFSSVPANIVMANGLKLWILGDKAASVPGLSYTPQGINSTKNMCMELKDSNNKPIANAEVCKNAGGYSCKGEGHCYQLEPSSVSSMGDARNCCMAADISDISYDPGYEKDNRVLAVNGFTIFADINGDKGTGSLWEDVFPFFVSANGMVYPGYPLDAPKGRGDNVPNGLYLGGNNSAVIPVDVFYYENINGGSARKRVMVYPNVSFARGICFSRKISEYTPYCQNLGLKSKDAGNSEPGIKDEIQSNSNICNQKNCHVSVRNKLRFF